MREKRQGLIVWFQHRKNLKQIRKQGHIIYVSRKLKYVVLYVNQSDLESVETTLLKMPFVSKVDRSYRPFVKTDFENAKPDKAKMYDYKMGL